MLCFEPRVNGQGTFIPIKITSHHFAIHGGLLLNLNLKFEYYIHHYHPTETPCSFCCKNYVFSRSIRKTIVKL